MNALKGTEFLITEGLGFMDSNLAISLEKHGSEVMQLDSLIPEHGSNLYNIIPVESKLKVNISDMRDGNSLDETQRKTFLILFYIVWVTKKVSL